MQKIRLKHLAAAAICAVPLVAYPQAFTSAEQRVPGPGIAPVSVCDETRMKPAASAAWAALRLVCGQTPAVASSSPRVPNRVIVVGFVGGFVKADDSLHPEILFASYLREHYGREVEAKVFSNHDLADALSFVLQSLGADHDGKLSDSEKKNARIIIYGHSWGASETAALADELARRAIPVLLTIQIDIIPKPGQRPDQIPANVASAINFYQSGGPLHGQPAIVALDPRATKILGNIEMQYDHLRVNCSNYHWFPRTFNKPHHKIENDARVWNQIASLIETEIAAGS
jgi:pimeloyl-ACP methyl ester carboxylesterase